jgi:tetratricopeptide (TPR) repeat protein
MDSLKFGALMLGDTRRLDEVTTPMIDVLRRRQDFWLLQWTLLESAYVPTADARWDDGTRRLEEALESNRRLGDLVSRGLILDALTRLERSRGDYARALSVGADSVAITRDASGALWLGWTTTMLGLVLADLRAWPEALGRLEAALEAADRIGVRAQLFGVLGPLAWARLQAGDGTGAAAAAERWDAVAAEVRVPPGQAHLYQRQSYTDRARVALALGDVDRAEAIVRGLLGPLERSGIRDGLADTYGVLAGCAEARGELAVAEELLARGLEAAGEDGLPAARLSLRIALARVTGSAEHKRAAQDLVDAIAGSVGDEALAERFRSAALGELEGPARLAAEQR